MKPLTQSMLGAGTRNCRFALSIHCPAAHAQHVREGAWGLLARHRGFVRLAPERAFVRHWSEDNGERLEYPCPSSAEQPCSGRRQSLPAAIAARPSARHRPASSLRKPAGSRAAMPRHAGHAPTTGPDRPASPGAHNTWKGQSAGMRHAAPLVRAAMANADRLAPMLRAMHAGK